MIENFTFHRKIRKAWQMRGYAKWIYLIAGFGLVGLAVLGIFLPILPTTPLLLLAAWCFAQSSEKCHRWLMEHRVFGPIIQNWHEHRCIPKRAKIIAVTSIVIFGTYALVLALETIAFRIIGGMLCLTGLISVLRIPICKPVNPAPLPSEQTEPEDPESL